ncbi:MAG TPA: hypothetical protein DGB72_00325 [Gemmatimonadetes bacterium]|nr:hypothetical protein [Gemmatimonadota bacterium]
MLNDPDSVPGDVSSNGVGSRAKMLDAEVGESNPEQLDQLHRNQKRPQPDSRKLPLESHRC